MSLLKFVTLRKIDRFSLEYKRPSYLGWVVEDPENSYLPMILNKDNKNGALLQIAGWVYEGRGAYLFVKADENANSLEMEKGIPYIVQIHWRGEIEGRKLDECIYWYSVKHDGKKIFLEEV